MDLGKLLSIFITIYQINNWSIVYNPHQLQIYPTRKDPYVHLVISPGPLSKGPCGPANTPSMRVKRRKTLPSGPEVN